MKGYLLLLLHTHMPYVRKNGVFPVGEDWLYQVMADTYIPLLEVLSFLGKNGLRNCLSLTLTPVLCEQLSDSYVRETFVSYLETMKSRALSDREDFLYFDDRARVRLAEWYHEEFENKKRFFRAIEGDIVAAFKELEDKGIVEILTSSATHAFLKGFENPTAVRFQVSAGLDSHRKHFGREPKGFWIPECAYFQGIEELLESLGIEYTVVDFSAVSPSATFYPFTIGESKVRCLARNRMAHELVWDDKRGFPTGSNYLDSTKYYHSSGLHYWKVTNPSTPIEDKKVYERERALKDCLEHAKFFLASIEEELSSRKRLGVERVSRTNEAELVEADPRPCVLAAYDTELFGHGWKEGTLFIEALLRRAAQSEVVALSTISGYLERNPPVSELLPLETTWGKCNDSSTWINPRTQWMWRKIRESQERVFGMGYAHADTRHPLNRRMLDQAARELMLIESSDWPYMVAKDRAAEYATQRFLAHCERLSRIAGFLEGGSIDEASRFIENVEGIDRIFPWLDFRSFIRKETRAKGV